MKKLTISFTELTQKIAKQVIGSTKQALSTLQQFIADAGEWHRKRLLVDPGYPAALTAIVKAVVAIAVPRAIIASALIALALEILGAHSHRHHINGDDYWDELDY